MRILFFIDCLVSGGKERRLVELMKQLRLNPEIQIELAVMSSDIHYKEVFDLNIKIHYIIRKRRKDFSVFSRLYHLCKSYKPDILHCWDSMTAVYSVPICALLHIPLVNGMITDAPVKKNLLNKRWARARLTFPFSDAIIGNSLAGLRAYKASRSKSVCIYNGFDFARLDKIPVDHSVRTKFGITTKYIIGMVASFADNKDYKTYYNAAQLLLNKRNDITFLAIGNNTDSERSHNLINEKYIDNFRLLGKISNVESFVNIMDICVLSTFTEGISNAILEYMATGKAVIASAGGGTNEIVENNKTGFLISPSDPIQLSEKIELLLGDIELRNNMGRAGRQRIEDHFSIDKMVSKFMEVYRNLN